ncbi:MAG: hypothetical protein LKI53_03315 [Bacteroidales bacterium]|jgi:hypothetical protein|nr:hypothetical protein [Bacteroidales bacterium]
MKIFKKVLTVMLLGLVLDSCASIVSKSSWPLSINTNPSGAKIEITNQKGFVVFNGVTPSSVLLKSGDGYFTRQSYKIKISMDGYADRILTVDSSLNAWYIGNIVFGGIIGFLIVDPITGAMYKLDTEYINETLSKNPVSANAKPMLKIINVNDLPAEAQRHLVSIK